jgi:hypothetical protein
VDPQFGPTSLTDEGDRRRRHQEGRRCRDVRRQADPAERDVPGVHGNHLVVGQPRRPRVDIELRRVRRARADRIDATPALA